MKRREREATRGVAAVAEETLAPQAAVQGEADVTRVGYAPIVRVDAAQREIELCATSEAVDSHGTVFDYEASKEAFTRWIGNVREMHERRAVGTRVAVRCDDDTRKVFVRIRISRGAQDTWEKVLDGTLRGASIGALGVIWRKQRRSVAGQERLLDVAVRYELAELSLVDNPSNPDALGVQFVRGAEPDLALLDRLDASPRPMSLAEAGEDGRSAGAAQSIGDDAADVAEVGCGCLGQREGMDAASSGAVKGEREAPAVGNPGKRGRKAQGRGALTTPLTDSERTEAVAPVAAVSESQRTRQEPVSGAAQWQKLSPRERRARLAELAREHMPSLWTPGIADPERAQMEAQIAAIAPHASVEERIAIMALWRAREVLATREQAQATSDEGVTEDQNATGRSEAARGVEAERREGEAPREETRAQGPFSLNGEGYPDVGVPGRAEERPTEALGMAAAGNARERLHTAARGVLQACGCPLCEAARVALDGDVSLLTGALNEDELEEGGEEAAAEHAGSAAERGSGRYDGRQAMRDAALTRALAEGVHTSARRLDRLDETVRTVKVILQAGVNQLSTSLTELRLRVDLLEAQPMPGGPAARAVEKFHALSTDAKSSEAASGTAGVSAAEQMRALEALAGRLRDPQAQVAVAAELIRLGRS